MSKLPFIIIGCGGHSKCVIEALKKKNINIHSVFDDNPLKMDTLIDDLLKVQKIPLVEWWKDYNIETIIAIGSNTIRKKIANKLEGINWGNAIDPTAIISKKAYIGKGVYIGVNAIIQPGAIIGDHSIINTGAIIEHDVIIENYCHIGPGAVVTGGCKIGQGTLIGAGSIMIPEKCIGEWSIIGAGSVIVSHIASFRKAYGNPCQEKQNIVNCF